MCGLHTISNTGDIDWRGGAATTYPRLSRDLAFGRIKLALAQ